MARLECSFYSHKTFIGMETFTDGLVKKFKSEAAIESTDCDCACVMRWEAAAVI